MSIFFIVFLFILGASVGSFLNVLVDRIPKGKSILGRSHCEFCNKTLKTKDLIPLVSYISFKGRCRYCRKKLSLQYPILELITGTLYVVVYLFLSNAIFDPIFNLPVGETGFQFSIFSEIINFNELILLVFYLAIVSSLIVIFFADLIHYIIPDKILAVLLVIVSVYLILFNQSLIPSHLIAAIFSFIFFFAVFFVTRGKGMGLGDVKFAFIIGLMLGSLSALFSFYIAFLTGAAVGLILILWKKKGPKSIIPFGPFLVVGCFISLLFSGQILDLIPFI